LTPKNRFPDNIKNTYLGGPSFSSEETSASDILIFAKLAFHNEQAMEGGSQCAQGLPFSMCARVRSSPELIATKCFRGQPLHQTHMHCWNILPEVRAHAFFILHMMREGMQHASHGICAGCISSVYFVKLNS